MSSSSSSNDSDEPTDFQWVTDDAGSVTDPERALPEFELQYTIQSHDDRPDHCTIYPHDVDDETALTQWLSADEGSFVDAEERR